ncbi:MAG TPA: WD40 repeat domain-containing protein [Dictyobacter sp.]|jgi:WD40 repeat protein|nr:WD40 repeat domain-containing protein [Dictyobacter sp.]
MKSTPPMPCREWEETLMTRSNLLSEDERQAVQEHIQSCMPCKECFHIYQRLFTNINTISEYLQPPDIRQQLIQAIQQQTQPPEQKQQRIGTKRQWKAPTIRRNLFINHHHDHNNKNRYTFVKVVAVALLIFALLMGAWHTFMTTSFISPAVHAASLEPQNLRSYAQHQGWAHAVAWSPDGNYVASIWDDDTLEVWDAHTGQQLFEHPSGLGYALCWSPDSKYIAAVGADDTVVIWDIHTGQPRVTYSGHNAPVNAISWSPNGKYIASAGDDKTVQIWRPAIPANNQADITINKPIFTYTGHNASIYTVAWSPNSQRIASGGEDNNVKVWNAFTGDNQLTYSGHHGTITSVDWSPDGKEIVSGSYDGTAQVWNATTGVRITTYVNHQDSNCSNMSGEQSNAPIMSVDWSSRSAYIASASFNGTVQVWLAQNGAYVASYPKTICDHVVNWLFSVSWSPDGSRLVSGGKGEVFAFKIH